MLTSNVDIFNHPERPAGLECSEPAFSSLSLSLKVNASCRSVHTLEEALLGLILLECASQSRDLAHMPLLSLGINSQTCPCVHGADSESDSESDDDHLPGTPDAPAAAAATYYGVAAIHLVAAAVHLLAPEAVRNPCRLQSLHQMHTI